MANAMFAETLENVQHSTWHIPGSYKLNPFRENPTRVGIMCYETGTSVSLLFLGLCLRSNVCVGVKHSDGELHALASR
jgi:hypothetical protein